jgi:hypothetical protein
LDIRKYQPMPTRPCKYGLAFQDDSVFADFDVCENGNLYLVRISYDGYGCCEPQEKISEMDDITSSQLISAIESNSLDSPEINEILSRYFQLNRAALWEDALIEHGLIQEN